MKEDTPKDLWDKIEVLAKLIGAVLVPAIIAGSVYFWNSERTLRDNASTMTSIAVSILSQEREVDAEGVVGIDPLRNWAVTVLQQPNNPPVLSKEAARALRDGRRIGIHFGEQPFVGSELSLGEAESFYAFDPLTGVVMASYQPEAVRQPTSLALLMTLFVTFRAVDAGEIDFDTEVVVSDLAANYPLRNFELTVDQAIRLRFLVRAIALQPAGNAAVAIAEAISGSEEAFVERMNDTAEELGLSVTRFTKPHGLAGEGQVTTAREVAVLFWHLRNDYPQWFNLFGRLTTDVDITTIHNTGSAVLQSVSGVTGTKTGNSSSAGFNSVTIVERDDELRVVAVLGGRTSGVRDKIVEHLVGSLIWDSANAN